MHTANQPDMFSADVESDLFGALTQQAYVPDAGHVKNRLGSLLNQMRASATWPWDEAIVRLHRERSFDYLCGLLAPDEGAEWRERIAAEVARLDAAA
jgi:hypothetical protein